MSHYENLMTELRALAYQRGDRVLAAEADIHVDTLRALLGDKPPKSVAALKRLAEISAKEKTAAGAAETEQN